MKIAGHQFNLSTELCIIPDLDDEKTQHLSKVSRNVICDSNVQMGKWKRARGGRGSQVFSVMGSIGGFTKAMIDLTAETVILCTDTE